MDNVFIGISGIIGAGKTTLATHLAKILDLPVYYEGVINNEYLGDFYNDMNKYSFPLQIYLLNKRFRQHQQIIWQGKGGVQDRTIYEDSIFAKVLKDSGLMEERDYRTYIDLFNNMANFMRKPNLIIHLDVSPAESIERIKRRGREMERTITVEYLTQLYNAYEDFIKEISHIIPVIKVNWSEFRDPEEMAQMIKTEWEKMQNIRVVDFKKPTTAV
jgi:deoxyadenosine kinase